MMNRTSSDYTTFVTIQDILHPECRQVAGSQHQRQEVEGQEHGPQDVVTPIDTVVVIDDGQHPQPNHRQRWDVVWAEAKIFNNNSSNSNYANDNATTEAQIQQHQDAVATAIPPSTNNGDSNTNQNHNSLNKFSQEQVEGPNNIIPDAPYYHGNLLECLFGISMAIGCVLATLSVEIVTIVVYILAKTFYELSKSFQQYGPSSLLGIIFYFVALHFVLMTYILLFIDFVLFGVSILLTESLAISVGIINSVLSCFTNGLRWHQYIRKICHLTRWAFRDIYPSGELKRNVFISCLSPQQKQNNQLTVLVNQQHHHGVMNEITITPTSTVNLTTTKGDDDITKTV